VPFEDINTINRSRMNRLHIAAYGGKTEVCLALLKDERFTLVDAVDDDQKTALHFAAEGELTEVCGAIFEHASLDWLPTDEALFAVRKAVICHLASMLDNDRAAFFLSDCGVFHRLDAHGADGLHLAAKSGCINLCKTLTTPPHNMDPGRKDNHGHSALDLALGFTGEGHEEVKAWADTFGTFLGRYKLGKVEHESATSKVVHAVDTGATENEPHDVVVKFMANQAQHAQELETRERSNLDPKFTVAILATSVDDSSDESKEHKDGGTNPRSAPLYLLRGFAAEATKCGNYPHGIVMEAGERNLAAIYRHEKPSADAIRDMFKQMFEAVAHLHSKDIMHGDLKSLNVVRFHSDNKLRLIDFDAAASIPGDEPAEVGVNEWAGAKFSSGTLPPEMFYRFENEKEREAYTAYFAQEAAESTTEGAASELWEKIKPKKGRNKGSLLNGIVVKTFHLGTKGCEVEAIPSEIGLLGKAANSTTSGAEPPASLPYMLEAASKAIDMWALGTLLFLFVTGENLVQVNRDDDISKIGDMVTIAEWSEGTRDSKLSVVKDPATHDLLEKLLHPDKKVREEVNLKGLIASHPFFNPGSENKEIAKVLDEINERTKAIKADTGQLIVIGKALKDQLKKTQDVLLTGIFEATEVSCPTSCIIVPYKLDRASGVLGKISELFEGEEDDGEALYELEEDEEENGEGNADGKDGEDEQEDGEEEEEEEDGDEEEEEEEEPRSRFGRMKRWFNKAVKIGETLKDGETFDAVAQAAELAASMQATRFYLYLIDEVTGKPVIPDADDGSSYPIEITKPAEWVGKLMPFMKAGLKVMSVANGVLSVAQCFFPGVPKIPASIRNKAKTAVGNLDKKSSVDDFDALSGTLDEANGEEGKKNEGQRGAALREFKRFLDENDKEQKFAGLRRTVFKTGEKEGTAVWTLEEDEAVIFAKREAGAEKVALEDSTYEMLESQKGGSGGGRDAGTAKSTKVAAPSKRMEMESRVSPTGDTGYESKMDLIMTELKEARAEQLEKTQELQRRQEEFMKDIDTRGGGSKVCRIM
jgi:serine/threonine protein kinase